MGRTRAVGPGGRGGGGIPAIRATPYGLSLGVAPFLFGAAIGGVQALAGLDTGGSHGAGVFLAGCLVTLLGSGWLSSGVRNAARREMVLGLLLIGTTYGAVVFGHHDSPLAAGAAGLALLGLAHLSHSELDRTRRLPTEPGAWPWRVTLALGGACVLLDGLVAVVSGGGRPRPGSPSTWSVLVGCLVVAGAVTALTALADGAGLPARRTVPDLPNPGDDRLTLTLDG